MKSYLSLALTAEAMSRADRAGRPWMISTPEIDAKGPKPSSAPAIILANAISGFLMSGNILDDDIADAIRTASSMDLGA